MSVGAVGALVIHKETNIEGQLGVSWKQNYEAGSLHKLGKPYKSDQFVTAYVPDSGGWWCLWGEDVGNDVVTFPLTETVDD